MWATHVKCGIQTSLYTCSACVQWPHPHIPVDAALVDLMHRYGYRIHVHKDGQNKAMACGHQTAVDSNSILCLHDTSSRLNSLSVFLCLPFGIQTANSIVPRLHIQSTIFGQFVRLATGNKPLQYPDGIIPSLWKKALQQDGSLPDSQGASDGSRKRTQDDATANRELPITNGALDALVVGWYGPDDPEVAPPPPISRTLLHLLRLPT